MAAGVQGCEDIVFAWPIVYYDYWMAGRNGLFSTKDLKTMNRISDQFVAPTWVRNGSAFKVPEATVDALNIMEVRK